MHRRSWRGSWKESNCPRPPTQSNCSNDSGNGCAIVRGSQQEARYHHTDCQKRHICLANPHEDKAHSRFSSLRVSVSKMSDNAAIATIIGTGGTNFALAIKRFERIAAIPVKTAANRTFHTGSLRTPTNAPHRSMPNPPVMYHL